MPTSPAKKALRAERKASGLCIHCGEPAIRRGEKTLTRCEGCADRDGENRQRYAERDEANGICRNTGCANAVEPGRKHCKACNTRSGRRSTQRQERRVIAGMCRACNKVPPLPGITRCENCRERLKRAVHRLQENRIAAGFCGRCGEGVLVDGYRSCRKCIDKGIARHAALKRRVLDAYGGPVCVGCGEDCFEVLQVDHVGGGGHRHALKLGDGDWVKGRSMMYRHLRDENFPPGYRVLCPTCNVKAARGIALPREKLAEAQAAFYRENADDPYFEG